MSLLGWLLLLLVVLVAVFCVGLFVDRRRGEMLEGLARRLDFGFAPQVEEEFTQPYESYWPFGQGQQRRAANLIAGQSGRIHWRIFDYQYTTGEGKEKVIHAFGVIAAHVAVPLPKLIIRPQGHVEPLTAAAGLQDLAAQSEEFARRFHAASADLTTARRILYPRMEEFLLGAPPAVWQMDKELILLARPRPYSAAEIQQRMKMVEGLLNRLPPGLLSESAGGTTGLPAPVR